MPRISREEHENLLSELMNPELEHARRTEVLTAIRAHDDVFNREYSSLEQERDKHKTNYEDAMVANNKLWRQTSYFEKDSDDFKKQEDKALSETITIEDLEKR